ncbi:hypothetical protein [Spirillospora sp. CA-294931]|uniref:hypothetical protein n=1 Tax=Spirillospora sp. CA-294931 TaxID=3240042 RepID=UPI003D927095
MRKTLAFGGIAAGLLMTAGALTAGTGSGTGPDEGLLGMTRPALIFISGHGTEGERTEPAGVASGDGTLLPAETEAPAAPRPAA